MRCYLNVLKWAIVALGIAFAVILLCVVFDDAYFHYGSDIDTGLASDFGDFVGGFIGTLFGFLSVVLLAYSILKQTYETRRDNIRKSFFKMIDCHYKFVPRI